MENRLLQLKSRVFAGIEKDFSFNAFSYLVMALSIGLVIILDLGIWKILSSFLLLSFIMSAVWAMVILSFFPAWITLMLLQIVGGVCALVYLPREAMLHYGIVAVGLLIACMVQLVYEWDKVVVLRAGRFHKVHSPGLFTLFPVLDRAACFVDTRIRATDFKAEKSLTRDTVPVHVDALAFWMIWDAQKAILEVEDYMMAVELSAQTALRDSIGKHDLSVLLSEREIICNQIQKTLDEKTNPWGITILSVEIHEIIIPQALEDAMSKQAQAEREKQSRIILGTAEVEIAKKFEEASVRYRGNPEALQLRAMNMVYEGMKNNGSLVLLPTNALDSMNVGSLLGYKAATENKNKTEERGEGDPK